MNKKEQAQEVNRRQLYQEAKTFAEMIKYNDDDKQIQLMREQFPDLIMEEIIEILEKA